MLPATLVAALLAVASPITPAAPAPAPEALALVKKVQGFYERTRDLSCAFTQVYTYAGLGRKATSTGTLLRQEARHDALGLTPPRRGRPSR